MAGYGVVNGDALMAQVDAWLASIDRNGEGVITTADFGPRG